MSFYPIINLPFLNLFSRLRLLFFGASLLISLPALSQYKLSWINGFGTTGLDYPASIDIDKSGNVYATGVFDGTMDVDLSPFTTFNLVSQGAEDIFVVKYDAAGKLVWAFSLGTSLSESSPSSESVLGISVDDASGHFYLTGILRATLNLNPSGTFNLSPNPGVSFETFVAKYDLNSGFVCGLKFGGSPGSINTPQTISKVVNGEFIIGGGYKGTVSFDAAGTMVHSDNGNGDMYLAKVDQNCNLVWVQSIGGAEKDILRSVEQTGTGEIYITGSYKGTVDFDPSSISTSSHTSKSNTDDIFIAKYNSSGNYAWSKSIGNAVAFSDFAHSITIDKNNDLLVVGRFRGTLNFNPGGAPTPLTSTGNCSGFFAKYDSNTGALKWAKGINPQTGSNVHLQSVTTDNNNHIYLWGEFMSGGNTSLNVGSTLIPLILPFLVSSGGSNMEFMAEYDANGDVVCANTICSVTATLGNFFGDRLIRVTDTAIYMAGVYNKNTVTSNPCNPPVNMAPINGQASFNSYVAKFDKKLKSVVTTTNDSICMGDSLLLTASGGAIYQWSTGETNDSVMVKPVSTSTYSVIVSDSCGCALADTAYFTVYVKSTASILISGDASICSGGTTVLSANATGSFQWSTGETTSQISVSPAITTTYSLVAQGCGGMDTVDFSLIVYDLPVVDFSFDDTTGCSPLCVNFFNATLNSANCHWDFGNGDTSNQCNPSYCYTMPGNYSPGLRVTDINGCSSSTTSLTVIEVYPNPFAQFSFNPPNASIADNIQFLDLSTSASAWQWSFGDAANSFSSEQNPQFTYPDIGKFSIQLIVSNQWNCMDTTLRIIDIKEDYALYVPNTFTPNDDELNDIFKPVGIGIDTKEFALYIFDRWGNLIYQTSDYNKGWNGRANGGKNLAQQDVYVWKINFKDTSNLKHQYIGNVNLIR